MASMAYTVTIDILSGMPTVGRDNIAKMSLTVSQTNDANSLSLKVGDTIKWAVGPNLQTLGWSISGVTIGKKLANKNSTKTEFIFAVNETPPDPSVGPADVFELEAIKTPTEATPICSIAGEDNPAPRSRVKFEYRIMFIKGVEKFFIDPELDVSPSM